MSLTVTFTEEQVDKLLAVLDCYTPENEPDWYLDEADGTIRTWAQSKDGKRVPPVSLQEHLDRIIPMLDVP